jgi:hypothetical protein
MLANDDSVGPQHRHCMVSQCVLAGGNEHADTTLPIAAQAEESSATITAPIPASARAWPSQQLQELSE